MNPTETSDETISPRSTTEETVSARSTSSFSDDNQPVSIIGGGDGPSPTSRTRKYEKFTSRLPEKRSFTKPKTVKLRANQKAGTKIPTPLSQPSTLLENKKSDGRIIVKAKGIYRDYMSVKKNFNCRKSFSTMNLKEVRNSRRSSNKVPQSYSLKPYITQGKEVFDNSMHVNEQFYSMMRENANCAAEEKNAGMKIFATIMLNAWRKRRDEVKHLTEEVSKSRKASIKVKNQIHVLNSMFKIEQKQNDELNARLRRMIEEQHKLQNRYNQANLSLTNLKESNCSLQLQFVSKEKEIEALEAVLVETKAALFKSMAVERELDTALSCEQRKLQELENCKNELYSQISQLKFELCEKQIKIQEGDLEKNEEIVNLKNQLDLLEKRLLDLKEKEFQVRDLELVEIMQKQSIEDLTNEVNHLREEISSHALNRIRRFLDQKQYIVIYTFRFFHLFSFYLLPAVPPPKLNALPRISFLEKNFVYFGNK